MSHFIRIQQLESRRLLASISGTVFNDQNADQVHSPSEPAIPSATVFTDANANRQLDSGEQSVVTDSEGAYRFDGLAPGSYRVIHLAEDGWQRTSAGTGALYAVRSSFSANLVVMAFDPLSGETLRSFTAPTAFGSTVTTRTSVGSNSLFFFVNDSRYTTKWYHEVDLNTGTLEKFQPVETGNVSDIAWLNGKLYLLSTTGNTLSEFNPDTGVMERVLNLPAEMSGGLAADADSGTLLATAADSSAIYALRPEDGSIVRTIPIAGVSQFLTLACVDGMIFTGSAGSGVIKRFDAESGAALLDLPWANPGSYTIKSLAGDGGVGRIVVLSSEEATATRDFGDIELSAIPDRPLSMDIFTGRPALMRVSGVRAGSTVEIRNPNLSLRENPLTSQVALEDNPAVSFPLQTVSFLYGQSVALQQEPGKRQSLFSPVISFSGYTPDVSLTAASDTGASSSDLITRNNQPTFTGSTNTIAPPRVVLNGFESPPATLHPTSFKFTYTPVAPLPDGTYYLNRTSLENDGRYWMSWTSKTLVIDTKAPTLLEARVNPNANSVEAVFSESLASGSLPAFRLIDSQTAQDVTPAGVTVQASGDLISMKLPDGFTLPPGDYRVEVGPGVSDLAGNLSTETLAESLIQLACDGTRDGRVDTADFNLLAGSFGQSTNLVLRGDFDMGGAVDSLDFTLFISHYGEKGAASIAQSVPTATALFPQAWRSANRAGSPGEQLILSTDDIEKLLFSSTPC